jgi:hypothetical protein
MKVNKMTVSTNITEKDKTDRQTRLGVALRENLRKRKGQRQERRKMDKENMETQDINEIMPCIDNS